MLDLRLAFIPYLLNGMQCTTLTGTVLSPCLPGTQFGISARILIASILSDLWHPDL